MKTKILLVAACLWFSGSASAVQVIEQSGSILVADSNVIVPADLDFSTCGIVIGANNSVDVVDISGCQLVQVANACLAVADLAAGTVNIPCVALKDAEDTEYVVNMVQRGSSMNWDVTFVDYNYRKAGKKK